MASKPISDVELAKDIPESDITLASKTATPKLFSLAGKTVAITGGGRGLGITLAIAVVEAGGCVACLDILPSPSAPEWQQLTSLSQLNGLAASYRRCDVTDEKAVQKAMGEIAFEAEERGATFWGVIACAGVQQTGPALEYPMADFERIIKVNVTGVFNTCKYAAQILEGNKTPGSIVMIASMSGNIANRVSGSWST